VSFDLGPEVPNPAGQAPQTVQSVAPISDLTYQNYTGPIKSHAVRWWVVSLALIRANVNRNRPGFWVPIGIIFLIYLIYGAAFYFSKALTGAAGAAGAPIPSGPSNPYSNLLFNAGAFPLVVFCLFVTALTVGSASIAADNRANALLVYLSKPLTRLDYLVGKWMAIFLLLSVVLLVPSLLLFAFMASMYYNQDFFQTNPTLFLRLIPACLVLPAIHASVVMGISAWSKSARTAGAAFAAFYLIIGVMTTGIGNNLKGTGFPDKVHTGIILDFAGIDGVSSALQQRIYGVDPTGVSATGFSGGRRHRKHPKTDVDQATAEQQAGDEAALDALAAGVDPLNDPDKHPPLAAMFLLLALYIGIPTWAAYHKVRAVEVIRG